MRVSGNPTGEKAFLPVHLCEVKYNNNLIFFFKEKRQSLRRMPAGDMTRCARFVETCLLLVLVPAVSAGVLKKPVVEILAHQFTTAWLFAHNHDVTHASGYARERDCELWTLVWPFVPITASLIEKVVQLLFSFLQSSVSILLSERLAGLSQFSTQNYTRGIVADLELIRDGAPNYDVAFISFDQLIFF